MSFSQLLINWYNQNKRELPWRETSDPYKIWISEIILQQTRVKQGLSYYYKFIDRFPDVLSLSNADEEEVLKLWQGLGYYSRARNLHAAAREIVSCYNGKFPEDHQAIIRLKGIGNYTAAAICSFAYNLPYAAIDGNVYRIFSRVFEIRTAIDSGAGKKEFALLAAGLIDEKKPGTFNQAIMDLGALICTPLAPRCGECPLNNLCLAYANKSWDSLPVKKLKTKQRDRYFYYFYITNNSGKTFLSKRKNKDIWKNLYELPLFETDQLYEEEIINKKIIDFLKKDFFNIHVQKSYPPIRHTLSHQHIHTYFFRVNAEKKESINHYMEIEETETGDYPVSRLTEIFLTEINGQ
jgi:A/G-specific adenine glycosylase